MNVFRTVGRLSRSCDMWYDPCLVDFDFSQLAQQYLDLLLKPAVTLVSVNPLQLISFVSDRYIHRL